MDIKQTNNGKSNKSYSYKIIFIQGKTTNEFILTSRLFLTKRVTVNFEKNYESTGKFFYCLRIKEAVIDLFQKLSIILQKNLSVITVVDALCNLIALFGTPVSITGDNNTKLKY